MFSPCKKCLVRACCSEDCKEFSQYIKYASEWGTFVSIMIAGIIAATILILSDGMNPEYVNKNYVLIIWIICTIGNYIFNKRTDEKLGEFVMIIFAPFVFIVFVILHLCCIYIKHCVRKRA